MAATRDEAQGQFQLAESFQDFQEKVGQALVNNNVDWLDALRQQLVNKFGEWIEDGQDLNLLFDAYMLHDKTDAAATAVKNAIYDLLIDSGHLASILSNLDDVHFVFACFKNNRAHIMNLWTALEPDLATLKWGDGQHGPTSFMFCADKIRTICENYDYLECRFGNWLIEQLQPSQMGANIEYYAEIKTPEHLECAENLVDFLRRQENKKNADQFIVKVWNNLDFADFVLAEEGRARIRGLFSRIRDLERFCHLYQETEGLKASFGTHLKLFIEQRFKDIKMYFCNDYQEHTQFENAFANFKEELKTLASFQSDPEWVDRLWGSKQQALEEAFMQGLLSPDNPVQGAGGEGTAEMDYESTHHGFRQRQR